MSRTLWVVAAVTMMALCWGSIIFGVGSILVTINHESLNASLCRVAPELRLTPEPPTLLARTAKPATRTT